MEVLIPYGKTHFPFSLPETCRTLSIREVDKKVSPDLFAKLLSAHLEKEGPDLSNTTIVVADKTRVCGYPEYLPVLVETLKKHGLLEKNLSFLIAYGTHPRQSDDECRQGYGNVYDRFRFVHHFCHNKEDFTELGVTSRKVPVRIRNDILKSSFIITMGPICHHYFAGYGGGRKLLFPGLGEKDSIYANHGLYLDRENTRLQPDCQPGILNGNPLAEDLFEISAFKEADLSIHGIMNSHGELCDILLGRGNELFLEACSIHGSYCEIDVKPAPLVIASCGGYPKDINYIQSHKAIHNSAMFVEDGGTLIVYTECSDAIGSKTFLPWFDEKDFKSAFAKLSRSYEGNGGTALATMTKTQRIKILLVTNLLEKVCRKIGVTKLKHQDAQEVVKKYIEKIKTESYYIPNGSLLVKRS